MEKGWPLMVGLVRALHRLLLPLLLARSYVALIIGQAT